MRNLVTSAALALVLAAGAAGAANAQTVIFDTKALSEGASHYETTENRPSNWNYAAVLSFAQDTTVSQLGVWSSVDGDQDVKFLIFDSARNGGSGSLLFSQTKHFASTGQEWLYSNALNFTFQAGHTYDFGILGSGNSLTGSWAAGDVSANGITAISNNANFSNFNAPTTGGYAGVVPYVQLLQGTSPAPEPASWAMMVGGFGLVGGAMRSRRKAAVSFA